MLHANYISVKLEKKRKRKILLRANGSGWGQAVGPDDNLRPSGTESTAALATLPRQEVSVQLQKGSAAPKGAGSPGQRAALPGSVDLIP